MGVLAVDGSLAAQCEQPHAQATAYLITGHGFAKAAGDDPQHVRRVVRKHRERRATRKTNLVVRARLLQENEKRKVQERRKA